MYIENIRTFRSKLIGVDRSRLEPMGIVQNRLKPDDRVGKQTLSVYNLNNSDFKNSADRSLPADVPGTSLVPLGTLWPHSIRHTGSPVDSINKIYRRQCAGRFASRMSADRRLFLVTFWYKFSGYKLSNRKRLLELWLLACPPTQHHIAAYWQQVQPWSVRPIRKRTQKKNPNWNFQ